MKRDTLFPILFMFFMAITPILTVEIPRILAFWPQLIGVSACVWYVFGEKNKLQFSKFYFRAILGISIFCIVSSVWSIAPVDAFKDALKVSIILFSGIFLISFCNSIDIKRLVPHLWMLPFGLFIAASFCLFELHFNLPTYKAIREIPYEQSQNISVMNRGIVCTVFAFFISLPILKIYNLKPVLNFGVVAALSILLTCVLLASKSQSAQMAFAVGLLCIAVFPYRRKNAYHIVSIAIIAVMFLTPAIVNFLYSSTMSLSEDVFWLKNANAGHRIEIWDFIMRYALNSPLYGYGIEATRYVTDFEHEYIYHSSTTVLHPHNFSVQIWMEFGLLGVVASSILIFVMLGKIKTRSDQNRRFMLPLILAILSASATAYGIWQSWWLGELIYISSLCTIIFSYYRKNEETESSKPNQYEDV